MYWHHFRLPALLAAGMLAFAGCGADDESARGAAEGNGIDRAFVAAMVPHHRSAVEMAKIAQNLGQSRFVKRLAGNIIDTQNAEISTMLREDQGLENAGVRPGNHGMPEHETGMTDDPAMLRDARPFDREFIDMMIPHHQGAIRMARVEMAKGKDPELMALAEDIVDAQAKETEEMNTHRKAEFGAASPAGGVPAGGEGSGSSHSG